MRLHSSAYGPDLIRKQGKKFTFSLLLPIPSPIRFVPVASLLFPSQVNLLAGNTVPRQFILLQCYSARDFNTGLGSFSLFAMKYQESNRNYS